jgi:rSAM/selenodomain-associated transferase 2
MIEQTPRLRLSIVIPTLNEASAITGAVRSALAAGADHVVVADGGSHDRTAELARSTGATVVTGRRGRGPQQNAGAAATYGEVLCFLHADVRLPAHAADEIRGALVDDRVVGGNFRVVFGASAHGRILSAFYHVIRRLGLFYGDSTIFCRREAFEAVRGFPPHPIMEDVALAQRLRRRGQMAYVAGPVRASPRRWEHGGIAQAWASWLVIQSLYFAHVPPTRLARLYRHIR